MADLDGLIERLEKAGGPDRELDYAIHEHFQGEWLRRHGYRRVGDIYLSATPPVDGAGVVSAPEYLTQSIDAALALVERLSPTNWWGLFYEAVREFGRTTLGREHLPRFILLALLKALRTQPTNAGNDGGGR